MAYHIFHNVEDFWKQVEIYKSEGYYWIQESHYYNPKVTQEDMPGVLNADENKQMMFGIIKSCKTAYFSNPEFVKLYKKSLREKKLERIINGES